MSNGGRLRRHEVRKVPVRRTGGEEVICAVQRMHDSFVVTDYKRGQAEPLARHHISLQRRACTCGAPFPCDHARAVWQADPSKAHYKDAWVPAQRSGSDTT